MEAGIIFLSVYYVSKIFMGFMGKFVDGLYLTMLTPMSLILSLILASFLVSYLTKPLMYYIKLAHIIFITSLVNGFDRKGFFAYNYAFKQATLNFSSLAVNDFTARGLVKILASVLKSLKEAIFSMDVMSHLKEPETHSGKYFRNLLTKPIIHTLDMVDELVVSYTWLAVELHNLANDNKPTIKERASFMIESLVFVIKVSPKLILSSLLGEIVLYTLINGLAILIVISYLTYMNFSLFAIVTSFTLFTTLIKIIYYALAETIRVGYYIPVFYLLLRKVEPLSLEEEINKIAASVPGLTPLLKKSGMEITSPEEPTTSILGPEFKEELRQDLTKVCGAMSLNINDYIEPEPEPLSEVKSSPHIVPQPKAETKESREAYLEDILNSDEDISVDDIDFEDEPFDPFSQDYGQLSNRRGDK